MTFPQYRKVDKRELNILGKNIKYLEATFAKSSFPFIIESLYIACGLQKRRLGHKRVKINSNNH